MTKYKNLKIFAAALIATGLLSTAGVAMGDEKNGTPEKVSYKFRALKDKISALSVKNAGETAGTALEAKPSAAGACATGETAIIKTVDGVTVIGNDPAKAAKGGTAAKEGDGKPRVWVEDRVRFERNSYKTPGANLNRSSIINRMRVNLKMNLDRRTTANFSADQTGEFGDKTQNRGEEPVTRGNVVIDLDK